MNDFSYIVVIPIFNEEVNINYLIRSILSNFIYSDEKCKKIIFVDDGSTDKSAQLLKSLIFDQPKLCLLENKLNLGYGGALKTAIKKFKNEADYLVFIDSDLTNPLSDIKKMFRFMKKKIAFIQANRYLGDLSKIQSNRKIIGILGNYLCRIFMGMKINDYTNGFRAVKADLYNNIYLSQNDFSIIIEEKFKLKKKIDSISEFPTTLLTRPVGLKKSSFNYSFKLISKYLYYCMISCFYSSKNIKKID